MKIYQRFLAALGIALLALGLTGCGAKDNTAPPKPLVKLSYSEPVHFLWSTQTGSGTGEQSLNLGPAVNEAEVVTADCRGKVTLLDRETGEKHWQVDLKQPLSSAPLLVDGKIWVGTLQGQLIALQAEDGKILWTATLSSSVFAPPAVEHKTVVVHVHNGDVVALDEDTGKQLWIKDGNTPDLILTGDSAPVITGELAIVGFANGQLAAFNLANGQVVWQRPIAIASGNSVIAQMVDIDSTPLISDQVVYAVSYHGNAVAVGLQQGNLIWQTPLSAYQNAALSNDKLIMTDENSHVIALDQKTGRVLWHQDALEARTVTAPVVVGEAVAVGDYAGYVHWLSLEDGHFLARARVAHKAISTPPAAYQNIVYVTTQDGKIVAVQAVSASS